MSATISELESWIETMMKKLQISKYKLDISGGNTTKGDGYLGEVAFLKVIAEKNGVETSYNLVVKSAKKSEELRKQTPLKEAYEREIFMYTKVLPNFLEFQKEQLIEKPYNKFPKCYSVCNTEFQEAVILENMKSRGFELHDRQATMNLNHALFVFQNYGKLHALSFAIRRQKPALFTSLTKNMCDVFGKFFTQGNLISGIQNDLKNVLEWLKHDGREDVVKKYDGFSDQIEPILTKSTNSNSPASVILHGDCWNNNFMFKYDDLNKNKPTDMCFLDFQLSRVASPVFDLSYFLYACADKQVLQDFDFLLQAYHSSLADSLKQFGLNVEDILTFKELQNHWKKYGKYGLSLSLFIIKIELCDSSEAPDFEDAAADEGGLDAMFDFNIANQDLYEKRTKEVFIHFAEKFL